MSISDCATKMQEGDALGQLKVLPQWVCYIFVSRGKKITKPPINPNVPEFPPRKERMASVTDPETWASYEKAVATWKRSHTYKGVGFVLTATDPFCGIDLDHCIDADTGKIAPWALHILKLLNSYSEKSARGDGIHIFVKASLSGTQQALGITNPDEVKHKKGDVEVYDQERYLTWNGKHIEGTPKGIEERQDEINEFYFRLFCIQEEEDTTVLPSVEISVIPAELSLDDNSLIKLAENAKGNNGRLFSQLWRGNLSRYKKADSGETDYSQADLALCSILAYWTQKDAGRMDRIFRQSALYAPEERQKKWDRRARGNETYGEGTIRVAIENCYKVYDPNWRPIPYDQYIKNLRKQTFPQSEGETNA